MCNARASLAPTVLEEPCKRIQHCCATLRRSRNKRNVESCWLKSLTGFKLCATTRNNIQQHATGCANGRNMWHPTMVGIVGQQCCVRLHRALRCYLFLMQIFSSEVQAYAKAPFRDSLLPSCFAPVAPFFISFAGDLLSFSTVGTVFCKTFEVGRIRWKEVHMWVREQGLDGNFCVNFTSFFFFFFSPACFTIFLTRIWLKGGKHNTYIWMQSLVQENPPKNSDKFNVLEKSAMKSERTLVYFISDSLVRPSQRELL